MQKRTSAEQQPFHIAIVTLDSHLASTFARVNRELQASSQPIRVSLHAAGDWGRDSEKLNRCHAAIAQADIVVVTMLFMEEHIKAVIEPLRARRERCSAMVCCMSGADIVRLTRMGKLNMSNEDSVAKSVFKKLFKNRKKTQASSRGKLQMMMLRRVPSILRYVPGTAQDVRNYFMVLQYWLAGSDTNALNLIKLLANNYATGEHEPLRGAVSFAEPEHYPEIGLYHPKLEERMVESLSELSKGISAPQLCGDKQWQARKGRVGLLLMRAYVLAGNTKHYDAVIARLEAMGYDVIPAFASGLDARPAIDRFFKSDGDASIDVLLSLTGFALVGGPAYSDAKAAQTALAQLNVPYLAIHGVEFQTLEHWRSSERGLLPVEAAMMVALPELDGATGPMLFAGRSESDAGDQTGFDMLPDVERVEQLCQRVGKLIELRKSTRAQRKIAVVIFNFPPNAGATGTAAHLSVFESLFSTLSTLRDSGYTVDLPADVDALRDAVLNGNASQYGADANVHTSIDVDDYIAEEPYLDELEAAWGPAPGKQLSNGRSIQVLGRQFGNVLVSVQPGFGYSGDPMRLLFEKDFAPTHAFSAFYRYLRQDFSAHAVLHFGTHGALEFMPGKQTALGATCWPDRLIGALPNFYLYAANNASEGTIAKRRANATLLSYLTPPVTHAGLYKGLLDLKDSIDRWRVLTPEDGVKQAELFELIDEQASGLELRMPSGGANIDQGSCVNALREQLIELEQTLIPHGLHIVGQLHSAEQRRDILDAIVALDNNTGTNDSPRPAKLDSVLDTIISDAESGIALKGSDNEQTLTESGLSAQTLDTLINTDAALRCETELAAVVTALDAQFIEPVVGGDLLRAPEILPTGRNLHGFDPYRMPSANAVRSGTIAAERLLQRHMEDGNPFPQSMAMVLWGTDNLKTEGSPLAQVLALIGAEPRFDNYGRLCGAQLIPLERLGRPRIDVVVTLSGIFRDLLPLQTRLLAEASWLAASAEHEPLDQNYVRRNVLAYQAEHDCDLETAALRVFSNADGAYGAHVNELVVDGSWTNEDELAEVFSNRKSFSYNRAGESSKQTALFEGLLSNVEIASQNLDSVETGITTIDHYFDTLGGISRCVQKANPESAAPALYISDETQGSAKVRTLAEQVSLETRTRVLNPKWYEQMLEHGHEGVRNIEAQLTNTVGWSATTGQVEPWVYQQITDTFLLDEDMRNRLADLNPEASLRVANRLVEAHQRNYWQPDPETLAALESAGHDLEDRLEGVIEGAYA
jgi:magnesium chelatase subunit H